MLSARAAKCRVSGRGRRKGTFRSISFAMTRSRRATSATAVEKVFTTWRNATHEGLVARWSTESNRAPPALATDESLGDQPVTDRARRWVDRIRLADQCPARAGEPFTECRRSRPPESY